MTVSLFSGACGHCPLPQLPVAKPPSDHRTGNQPRTACVSPPVPGPRLGPSTSPGLDASSVKPPRHGDDDCPTSDDYRTRPPRADPLRSSACTTNLWLIAY